MELNNYIRDIQDFPKAGIIFKDITPLLSDGEAFAKAYTTLLNLSHHKEIDKVVAMESRGFFFGGLLAKDLGAGFVPVRKPGKLPHVTISHTYDLEYGTDTLEMHKDAIKPGDKVLIHDDVLATGGTAKAAIKLVESLGGVVVQCNFLITLDFLPGRAALDDYEIVTALRY